jgi:arylsulfatase A-like enzyme
MTLAQTTSSERDPAIATFRVGLWLGLLLATLKLIMLARVKQPYWGIGIYSLKDLPSAALMISFEDLLFGCFVGLCGWLAMMAVRRSPRAARITRRVHLTLCLALAFYGAGSIGVYEYFGRPLNFDLLRFVRDLPAIRSSVLERLSVFNASSLTLAPLALWLLAKWDARRCRIPTSVLAGLAAVWVTVGWVQARPSPDDWKSYRQTARSMAMSPHLELASSTFRALTVTKPHFVGPVKVEPNDEFSSFKARHTPAPPPLELPPGVKRPRNVIVMILESVGIKYLSLYGSSYPTTPCLQAEAANSIVFENIYAHASQTICSFRAINFSMYPGLPWVMAGWSERPLAPPLATALGDAGWRTAYFHNGTLDWGGDRWMLDERYQTVEDFTNWNCPTLTSWGAEDRRTFDRLINWIDEKPDQPFLAYCWTDQTHDPYLPSEGMQVQDFFQGHPPERHAKDLLRYLNVVHEVDRQLGRLFQALRERGLADDTLVVITGDHGEAFADPHLQRGHGMTVYEEELRVPLLFWNPRLFGGGKRNATIGGHVDINPTITSVLGIAPLSEWQGHSLFDPARPSRAFFMANISSEYLFGVREQNWKFALNATTAQQTLYDLNTDPHEQQSLAEKYPDRCEALRQRVNAWVSFEDAFLNEKVD